MIGQMLSHYQIVERLSEGAMGTVYRAQDVASPGVVAVKMVKPSDQDAILANRRFLREAEAIRKIDHPNVVRLFEVVRRGDVNFLVMEYVKGCSLRTLLRRERLATAEVVRILCEVTDGLRAAHERGVIHRDVKPENIIVTETGLCKLLDFGVARLGSASTGVGNRRIVGTLPYIAPEQLTGKTVDERVDIYSVGVLLFEMLVGRPPFDARKEAALFYQILNVDPPLVSSIVPSVPWELECIARRSMYKKPDDRYPSIAALRSDLKPLAQRTRFDASPYPIVCGRSGIWRRVSRWLRIN